MKKTFKLTPELTCPELVGYVLPELPRHQEDVELKFMAETEWGNISSKGVLGFVDGYTKACERYEFTREDMMRAIYLAQETHKPKYSPECEYEHTYTPEQILLILRTPIAIEVEMLESTAYNAIRIQDESGCFGYYIPNCTHDGTVKGRWVYE